MNGIQKSLSEENMKEKCPVGTEQTHCSFFSCSGSGSVSGAASTFFLNCTSSVNSGPVSYTHLDVYKRQVITMDQNRRTWSTGN